MLIVCINTLTLPYFSEENDVTSSAPPLHLTQAYIMILLHTQSPSCKGFLSLPFDRWNYIFYNQSQT